jgi:glucokinase
MTEFEVKYFDKTLLSNQFQYYVLGADVGGTNTNIGIAGVEETKINMLFSLNYKTKKLSSLIPAINKTLEYAYSNYSIKINNACIGGAGVVSDLKDFIDLTNVPWNIDLNVLQDQTELTNIHLLNDFQLIGYGLNLLNPKNDSDLIAVFNKDNINLKNPKIILGAGTGLGKTILLYNDHFNAYIPFTSEGGHADLPVNDSYEFELIKYIKNQKKALNPVTYEDVLSGNGLENIYSFIYNSKEFNKSKYTDDIDKSDNKPVSISEYKEKDEICNKTFELFTRFYARCAKNLALDSIATGGVYMAGGIAAKNMDIFPSNNFLNEFKNSKTRQNILNKIPIYIIINYDVSIFGACFAAMYFTKTK